MKAKVKEVIEKKVSPYLAMHGGGVELVEVTDAGIVKVRLAGACQGCPGAQMTLAQIVEGIVKKEVPQVKKVVAV